MAEKKGKSAGVTEKRNLPVRTGTAVTKERVPLLNPVPPRPHRRTPVAIKPKPSANKLKPSRKP